MGEFGSGKLILLIVFYFISFIAILSIVQVSASQYDIETGFIPSDTVNQFGINEIGLQMCATPRMIPNPNTGEVQDLSFYKRFSVACENSVGMSDENTCNSIEGCSWTTESTFLWFFTRSASCSGVIDVPHYTPYFTNQTTSLAKSKSSEHDTNTIYIVDLTRTIQYKNPDTQFNNILNGVCNLMVDERSCSVFGCQWVDIDDEQFNEVSFSSVFQITKGLFTFNISFTSVYWIDFLLTFMLFYMPLIALLIALYFALPFIH